MTQTKNQLKSDAVSLNTACQNYYTEVVAGTINAANSGNVTYDTLPQVADAASVRKSTAQKCTVYGAMQYAGLTDMESRLSEFCYDTATGIIFANIDDTKSYIDKQAFTKDTTLGELYSKESR